jgi:ABC-type lipoprotein export system ATPase subunit
VNMLFETENLEYEAEGRSILGKRSLSVEAGQHVLLLGSSGCGKTTLMNVMAGLLRPSSGEVKFEGKSYASLSEPQLDQLRAENFGFVFQKLHLIGHLSVEQNIALAQSKPDPKRIQSLIDDLALSGKEKQKARDLSVGEAQRVAIARAVANNPKVIFADEPTSALDDANAGRVMDLIFEQAKKTGATVVAATHDARIKDRFETVLEMAA